jgi:hypothetical protein
MRFQFGILLIYQFFRNIGMRAVLISENIVVELASFDVYLSIIVIQIEDEALIPDTISF